MNLLMLEYFKVVASYENMSKAAETLHVSQPAISKMIKQLELYFDTKLFDRTKGTIKLNQQGEILLKYTNKVFSNMNDARLEIMEYNQKYHNTLNISLTIASNLFHDILKEFSKNNHDINYNVTQTITNDLNFDVVIISSSKKHHRKSSSLALEEKILLALPIDHHLSKYDSVSLSQLIDEKFVFLIKNKPLRGLLDNFFSQSDFIPNIFWETDSPEMCRNIVESGLAISFFPSKTWQDYFSKKIKLVEINSQDFTRYLYVQLKPDGYQTNAAIKFRDFAINYLKKY